VVFCVANFVVEKSATFSGFIFLPRVKNLRGDFLPWFPFRLGP
jgi:hypothetical protein